MWMIGQCLPLGMQHGYCPHISFQKCGIFTGILQGFPGGLEQQVVTDFLVNVIEGARVLNSDLFQAGVLQTSDVRYVGTPFF